VGYIVVQQRSISKDRRLRAGNLSNFTIVLPRAAQLKAIRPLPANQGIEPWGPGEPIKLEDGRTGRLSFALQVGYYVAEYQAAGKTYSYGLYARGYGYDPSVELPAPATEAGYAFIPGGSVPSGDLLGVGEESEASTGPVTLLPYFIAVDRARCSHEEAASGRTGRGDPIGCGWNDAEGYARKNGARLPSLIEWEWAATLGLIPWQSQPRWEWTSTRSFSGPYDTDDGRDNPDALDVVRTIVGGGKTEVADDSSEVDFQVAAVTDFLARQPKIADELSQAPSLESDPTYLSKHPVLEDFLRTHPEVRDLVGILIAGDQFGDARPTRRRAEPLRLPHQFRLARSAGAEAKIPVAPIEVTFYADTATLDVESMKKLRRFAESWNSSADKPSLILEGNTDARGSTEYDLLLGDRLASSTKTALINEGIPANKITTFSYGKDRTGRLEAKSPYLFPKDDRVDVRIRH
jgi:outer membrane protein OmpA-like peptidoglycan-associated protein